MAADQDLSMRVRHLQKKILALQNQLRKEREMLKKERDLTGSMARTAAQQYLMEDRPSSMSYEKWKASLLLESAAARESRLHDSSSGLLPVSSRGDSVHFAATSTSTALAAGKPFQYQPLRDITGDLTLRPFALRPQSPPPQIATPPPHMQSTKACVHWHTHREDTDADTEILFMKDGEKKFLYAHKHNMDVAERRPRMLPSELPVPIWTNHKFGNRDNSSGLQSNSFL